MNKKDRLVIGVVAGAIILFSVFLFFIYRTLEQQSLVLIITAGVVFWYAWETREMRKALVNQTKILSSPFISISLEPDFADQQYLKLYAMNLGEVTARNIRLESSQALQEGDEDVFFRPLETLAKGEKKDLKIAWKSKERGEITKGPSFPLTHTFLAGLRTRSLVNAFLFKLEFQNIFYETYKTDVIYKDQEFSMKNFQKKD